MELTFTASKHHILLPHSASLDPAFPLVNTIIGIKPSKIPQKFTLCY